MILREYLAGEELLLYEVFYSSIHENAKDFYSEEQINAWALQNIDNEKWVQRITGIKPYVVEDQNRIVAYGDIQKNGYIDHFFVRGKMSRRGIGTLLLNNLIRSANEIGIDEITSDVSLSAQKFFSQNGFEIIKRKKVIIRGIELENALMRKKIK